jgi:hypothetical protein
MNAWYSKNRERILAEQRAVRAADPEKFRQALRKWRADHPVAARRHCADWSRRHPALVRERVRRWQLNNLARYKAQQKRYKAARRTRLAGGDEFTFPPSSSGPAPVSARESTFQFMSTQKKSKPVTGNGDYLTAWLTDPRTAEYFGDTFALRADVLNAVINGGNLAAVARQHDVTRAAASKQARRAKTIYGNLRLTPSN